MRAEVLLGDCRDVLATLPDASVDAVVTDPPYALTQMSRGGSPRSNDPTKPYGRHRLADKGFMGQQWDNGSVAHDPAFWAEVRRVAKPGAFLLAFGGTRTYHRLACAIEDAGWELRDMIVHWLYGSGFPKSTSCLKPSQEPIVLAKAPGPLQPLRIDACRVATGESLNGGAYAAHGTPRDDGWGLQRAGAGDYQQPPGRWPPNTLFSHVGGPEGCQPAGVRRVRADKRGQGRPRGTFPHSDDAWGNGHLTYTGAETAGDGAQTQQEYLCVDGCPIKALDAQAGPRTSRPGRTKASGKGVPFIGGWQQQPDGIKYADADAAGSASRFFPTFGPDPEEAVPFRYQPKASRRDRGDGNTHSTVKPTNLMAWLCKLVTPEGGVVLDCFAGSGSTGVACVREGFGFIGIEQSAEYAAIARARIAHEQEQHAGPLFAGVSTATTAAR